MSKKANFSNMTSETIFIIEKVVEKIPSIKKLAIIASDGEGVSAEYEEAAKECRKLMLNKQDTLCRSLLPMETCAKIRADLVSDKTATDSICEWLLSLGIDATGAKGKTAEGILACSDKMTVSVNQYVNAVKAYDKKVAKGKAAVVPSTYRKTEDLQKSLSLGFITWAIVVRKALIVNADGSISVRGQVVKEG